MTKQKTYTIGSQGRQLGAGHVRVHIYGPHRGKYVESGPTWVMVDGGVRQDIVPTQR